MVLGVEGGPGPGLLDKIKSESFLIATFKPMPVGTGLLGDHTLTVLARPLKHLALKQVK